MNWRTEESPREKPVGKLPEITPREFVERMAENIAKTTIAMGGSVSTAYKAAALFAESCEALWDRPRDDIGESQLAIRRDIT